MPLPEITEYRLLSQLDCLPQLLAGTAPGSIDRRTIPDKWSARENLAHLARYQEVFLERITSILEHDKPAVGRYRAEEDPAWAAWASMPSEQVLERLKTTRREIVKRVANLSDAQLARTAVHSRFGELTLLQWLEFFLLHEAHHLLTVLQRVHEREP
jgi:uncharacterized damage-inducible protein DinB